MPDWPIPSEASRLATSAAGGGAGWAGPSGITASAAQALHPNRDAAPVPAVSAPGSFGGGQQGGTLTVLGRRPGAALQGPATRRARLEAPSGSGTAAASVGVPFRTPELRFPTDSGPLVIEATTRATPMSPKEKEHLLTVLGARPTNVQTKKSRGGLVVLLTMTDEDGAALARLALYVDAQGRIVRLNAVTAQRT